MSINFIFIDSEYNPDFLLNSVVAIGNAKNDIGINEHFYKGFNLFSSVLKKDLDAENTNYNNYFVSSKVYAPLHYDRLFEELKFINGVNIFSHPYSCVDSGGLRIAKAELLKDSMENVHISAIGHSVRDGIRFPASVSNFISVGLFEQDELASFCVEDINLKKPEICVVNNKYSTIDSRGIDSNFSGTSAGVYIVAAIVNYFVKRKTQKSTFIKPCEIKAFLLVLGQKSNSFYRRIDSSSLRDLTQKKFETHLVNLVNGVGHIDIFYFGYISIGVSLNNNESECFWQGTLHGIKLKINGYKTNIEVEDEAWTVCDKIYVEGKVEIKIMTDNKVNYCGICISKDER